MPPKTLTKDRPRVAVGRMMRADGDGPKTAPNGQAYDHRFIASTERVASDGGIIRLDGWRLDSFLQRPRFIAQHDLWGEITRTAIGRVVDIRVEDDLPKDLCGPSGRGLVAYVRFATTPYAQEIRTLYDEGIIDDVSVRWDPRTEEFRQPYEEEVEENGEELLWVVERADLIEISAVMVGADSGAQVLRSEIAEGLATCRAAGKPLKLLESLSKREGGGVDAPAVMDAVNAIREALTRLDMWIDAGAPVRTELAEGLATIENVLMAGGMDEEVISDEEKPEEEDDAAKAEDLDEETLPDPDEGAEEDDEATPEGEEESDEDTPPAESDEGEEEETPPSDDDEDEDEKKKKKAKAKSADLGEEEMDKLLKAIETLNRSVASLGEEVKAVRAGLDGLSAKLREAEPEPEQKEKETDDGDEEFLLDLAKVFA